MGLKINREVIADGVGFSEIIDPKIKTSVLKIKFITELNEKNAQLNTIAAQLVTASNSRIKSYSEMSDRLDALYGSLLYCDVTKNGDCQVISVNAGCIDNRFAFEGENILGDLLGIVHDCIFEPNLEGDGFDSHEFELKRRELTEAINSEINNKRWYAMFRAQKHIFKGEPVANSTNGTMEAAEKITPAQAYEVYKELLETAVIEIYFVSSSENHTAKEAFRKMFSSAERRVQKVNLRSVSPLKTEVCRVTEQVAMNQTKVIMAFKTKCENRLAAILAAKIFGGTPFSKLFVNVREKMSLCYYCSASYVYSKGTMLVESGVDTEKAEKLMEAVAVQLESVKQGDFTDEDLLAAKLNFANGIRSVNDTPSQIISWYFIGFCYGDEVTPEEELERVMKLTREDVIEAAKSFDLDTVFVMEANDEEGSDQEDTDE